MVVPHDYLSTACLHAQMDDRAELHAYCAAMTGAQGEKRPGRCKWCDARCTCPCHGLAGGRHIDYPLPAIGAGYVG